MKLVLAFIFLIVVTLAMNSCKTKPETPYRDLNKNGKKDVYEDITQSVENRVSDLLSQMNVEEKAGVMFISGVRINEDGSLDDIPGKGMFAKCHKPINSLRRRISTTLISG